MARFVLQVRTSGDLTTILWRDKLDSHILTNIHDLPAEGNPCDNSKRKINLKFLKYVFI